jgi:Trypsin-like peptidase domain
MKPMPITDSKRHPMYSMNRAGPNCRSAKRQCAPRKLSGRGASQPFSVQFAALFRAPLRPAGSWPPRAVLKSWSLALVLLAGLCGQPCHGSEIAEKGRAIYNQYQHAVVTVEIVLKSTYSASGQSSAPSENKLDATGTVVDPSGLTVLALSACDPGEMYQRLMAGQSKYKLETEVNDVKMLLEDGTELPAEIVLRDKDLDLAFVRPKTKPAHPMSAVDLSQSAPAEVLDEVITLNRLNKAASRAYAASIGHVAAVIQKPRTFYIPDSASSAASLGSPAFLLDGKILGVFVMRTIRSGGGDSYDRRQNVSSIILPASDILKAAKQAPEAKASEDKTADADESKDAGK